MAIRKMEELGCRMNVRRKGSFFNLMGVGTFKASWCSTRYKILGYLLDEVWHSTALPDRPLEARRILPEQQSRDRRLPGASYF